MSQPKPSTSQTLQHLTPPGAGLSFAQRLLFSGAAGDLTAQALDLGMLKGENLNAMVDEKPLIQHWVEKSSPGRSAVDDMFWTGQEASLSWPIGTDPTKIKLLQGEWWEGHSLWWEHAAIGLVRAGVDPTLPWDSQKHPTLIDWAHTSNRPWLLDACLQALPDQVRHAWAHQVHTTLDEYTGTETTHSWLHSAMRNPSPLLAQVWLKHGANLHAKDSHGSTPVFMAASVPTLKWALKAGANPSDLNHSNQLPSDRWRESAESVEEWSAMQELVGVDTPQALALIQAAVGKGDLEGFEKAYKLLNDPATTFPGGRTVIGHVAEQSLLNNDNTGRTRHHRKALSKMLAHLWTRTNWDAAQSQEGLILNDLQLAWVASHNTERIAARAAAKAQAKHPFTPASPIDILNWAGMFFDDKPGREPERAWARLREWVLTGLRGKVADGHMEPQDILDTMRAFHDTSDRRTSTWGGGLLEANVWAALAAKTRNGSTNLSGKQINQAFSEALISACRAVETQDATESPLLDLAQYQKNAQELKPDTTFNGSTLTHLATVVVAWQMLGGTVEDNEYPRILEAMESSALSTHPNFKPLEPVWALMQEQALDRRMAPASPSRKPRAQRM